MAKERQRVRQDPMSALHVLCQASLGTIHAFVFLNAITDTPAARAAIAQANTALKELDGALHYNPVPAALGFAQQHGAPILIVVCDNRGYTSQTWDLYKYFANGAAVRSGQIFGNVLAPTPDYVKLGEAYGGGGRVEKTVALESAIERALTAFAAGRSALLDVFVTP